MSRDESSDIVTLDEDGSRTKLSSEIFGSRGTSSSRGGSASREPRTIVEDQPLEDEVSVPPVFDPVFPRPPNATQPLPYMNFEAAAPPGVAVFPTAVTVIEDSSTISSKTSLWDRIRGRHGTPTTENIPGIRTAPTEIFLEHDNDGRPLFSLLAGGRRRQQQQHMKRLEGDDDDIDMKENGYGNPKLPSMILVNSSDDHPSAASKHGSGAHSAGKKSIEGFSVSKSSVSIWKQDICGLKAYRWIVLLILILVAAVVIIVVSLLLTGNGNGSKAAAALTASGNGPAGGNNGSGVNSQEGTSPEISSLTRTPTTSDASSLSSLAPLPTKVPLLAPTPPNTIFPTRSIPAPSMGPLLSPPALSPVIAPVPSLTQQPTIKLIVLPPTVPTGRPVVATSHTSRPTAPTARPVAPRRTRRPTRRPVRQPMSVPTSTVPTPVPFPAPTGLRVSLRPVQVPTSLRPTPLPTSPPSAPPSPMPIVPPTPQPSPELTAKPIFPPTSAPINYNTAIPTGGALQQQHLTEVPTLGSTISAGTAFSNLNRILSNASPGSVNALSDAATAQARAKEWLAGALEQGCYDDLSDARLVQMWALATLGYATQVDTWNSNLGWFQQGTDECNWYGISCSSGKVSRIDLESNGLGGTLPPELTVFAPSLKVLSVSDNNIAGTLPSNIGDLSNLEELKIDRNKLEGQVPASIGNLMNLKLFHLERNRNINGAMPDSIADLVNLQELVLYYTLIDSMTDRICDLKLNVLVLDCRRINVRCYTQCFYLCGGDSGIAC